MILSLTVPLKTKRQIEIELALFLVTPVGFYNKTGVQ